MSGDDLELLLCMMAAALGLWFFVGI